MLINGKIIRISLPRTHRPAEKFGFEFDRTVKGSHEIWFNPGSGLYTTIPNHPGDIPEGTVHAILKQAGITPDDFLKQ